MKIYDKLFIDGRWTFPDSDSDAIDVINPYTEAVCGQVPSANEADTNAAVMAARNAFDAWAATAPEKRAALIQHLAQKLMEYTDEISQTITMELGMPISMSTTIQSGLPAGSMSSYVDLAKNLQVREEIGNSIVIKEPAGVCAFITPWNYPLHQIVGKVAPALAAGCTMLVKPSSETPLNAFILAKITQEIGLPNGVFNLVTGSGELVGEALCRHPQVDLISFTGSTHAGRRIGTIAAQGIKRLTLELGGKSTNIILEDADFEKAVSNGVKNMFLNSGQTCSALSRMLVPENLLDQAAAIAKDTALKLKVGDPADAGVFMGPLVSRKQQQRVLNYIKQGIEQGAELICGGTDIPDHLKSGYFVMPTIFSHVSNQMTIAKEEIFGPVLCIIPFKDETDAVNIANDSIYGLSGAVWSKDQDRAIKIAEKLRTGQVAINGGRHNILAPFGGYKQSGRGREFGKFGLEEFLEIKSIQL
ncbi:MAG: aldehyde dehydrogenase family protein [Proteobacteria bacterium]|nr:aldehyde dehydrogenase family protein [Pseudomonadota bacterium]MBU1388449.1 aldehyde dehydrogenase family protein [Pseudomonadota bacterium]MBU1542727.1 aldehyde dehydrogenase family protein [Pseudomonadota bacterium]MBU2429635.1 aldehyde dehydrogenase family protein [Pseudomonadota bacterium]MBU2481261.1 aldehyde dehydrogenase family protein [Pseudomonadota bacterium]